MVIEALGDQLLVTVKTHFRDAVADIKQCAIDRLPAATAGGDEREGGKCLLQIHRHPEQRFMNLPALAAAIHE